MKASAIHVIFAAVLGLTNAAPSSNYLDWRTFKANGVNLGGWLHQNAVIDPKWWNQYALDTLDEWDFYM
ncbi:hypothetical protein ACHAPU_009058 [Fusarium lateritium]